MRIICANENNKKIIDVKMLKNHYLSLKRNLYICKPNILSRYWEKSRVRLYAINKFVRILTRIDIFN